MSGRRGRLVVAKTHTQDSESCQGIFIWVVTPCILPGWYQRFAGTFCRDLQCWEVGGGVFLRNVGISLEVHTALKPRRLTSTSFPPREQHIFWEQLNWLKKFISVTWSTKESSPKSTGVLLVVCLRCISRCWKQVGRWPFLRSLAAFCMSAAKVWDSLKLLIRG